MKSRRNGRTYVAEPLENRLLLAATDLDRSFSTDGIVASALNGGYNNARAVAVQADGKVIIVGEARLSKTSSTYGFAAIRYNGDGTLDDGGPNDSTPGDKFGTGGVFLYGEGIESSPTSVAIARDGKIVIGGFASNGSQQYWLLARLNSNGTLDNTFNHAGTTSIEFSIYNTPLTGIAVQPDGKVVAVGSMNGDFLVGRFNADGTDDTDFGDFGTVTTDFGGADAATGVALDNAGNIVVVGDAAGDAVNKKVGVVRYQTNGTPDPNFGTDGKTVSLGGPQHFTIGNIVIQPNGDIKVPIWYPSSNYTIGGTADFTFDGQNVTYGGGTYVKYTAAAVLPTGEIAYTGTDLGSKGTSNNLFLRAGSSEKLAYVSGYTSTAGTAVAVAPDGGIYVAGVGDVSGGRNFILLKYQGPDLQALGSVRGNVFRDTDGDGVRDRNESGTPNIRVYEDRNNDGKWTQATLGGTSERSVLTDANGNYTLWNVDLDKAVTIREILPGGTRQIAPAKHGYVVTAVAGKPITGLNFVNAPSTVTTPGTSIVGSVFNDSNNDAARQTVGNIEPDMTNVVVYVDSNRNGLYDTGERYAKTDVSGNFIFSLSKAGKYRVVVSPPRGYTNTSPVYRDVVVSLNAQSVARFALAPLDTNDSLAEARPLTLGRTFSDTIANTTDVNIYSFTAKAGQTILFDLDLGKSSSLNSYLRLFDSRGNPLTANDNAAASGETISLDSYIRYRFSKSGTYYIAVSNQLNTKYSPLTGKDDIGGGSIGAYSLVARAL